ncbi:mammalian cell entry protein, partial [Mycolicibacterium porcinum]
RLQERVVGRGPSVPQMPVIPSPTEPGEIIPAPAAPPEAPGPVPPPEAPPAPAPASAEAPR